MNAETRACQNCTKNFDIQPEDFVFYEKIQVPPPTFCWECRLKRRLSWRNERSLYKRVCAATGKSVISMFAPDQPLVVYEHSFWWSDKWDQLETAQSYDFTKPFFVQFRELFERAPLPNVANSGVINSEYGNHNGRLKNAYLTYSSYGGENLTYCTGAVNCKDSLDVYRAVNLEGCYDTALCGDCNRISFSYDSDESANSAFLYSCRNVLDSLGCVNLRSKSNSIFNVVYSKEEYVKERARYDLGSYKGLLEFQKKFADFLLCHPRRHAFIFKSVNTVGDNVLNVKNVYMGFDLFGGVEDSKYVIHGAEGLRDTYDAYGAGANFSMGYEILDVGESASMTLFSVFCHGNRNVQYSYGCHSSQDLFGCVGLRNKKYCIFNKQYSKEEYEALLPKIIAHMNEMPYRDAKGIQYAYGEFFPVELSPFAYNESLAQEYYPLTEEQVASSGYRWKKPEVRQHAVTLEPENIPDSILDTSDTILNETIRCAHAAETLGGCNEQCTGAFRIIASELDYLRRVGIALPRLCPNCRHYARLKRRTPFRLHDRVCNCAGQGSENGRYQNLGTHPHGPTPCKTEIKTSYPPERTEIIYCEQCYNAEVA